MVRREMPIPPRKDRVLPGCSLAPDSSLGLEADAEVPSLEIHVPCVERHRWEARISLLRESTTTFAKHTITRWFGMVLGCLALWTLHALPIQAQDVLAVDATHGFRESLAPLLLAYVDDQASEWKIHETPPDKSLFRPLAQVDFQGVRRVTGWLTVTLRNQATEPTELVLFTVTNFYPLHVYVKQEDGTLQLLGGVGKELGPSQADKHLGAVHLPLELDPGAEKELVIAFRRNISNIGFNFFIATPDRFQAHASLDRSMGNLFLGYAVAIFSFSLFFWWKTTRPEFLSYMLYLLAFAATNAVDAHQLGVLFSAAWIREYHWQLSGIGTTVTLMFAGLFARYFLKMNQNQPKLSRTILLLVILLFLNIPVTLYSTDLGFLLRSWLGPISGLVVLIAGLIAARKGFLPARYFCVGWGILVACYIVFVVYGFLDMPYNFFLSWILPIGGAIEMVVLSFGLVASIQAEREEDQSRIEKLNEQLSESNLHLQKSYDDLKASEAFRTRFFQNTSHELRTPLNGILGYLQICLSRQAAGDTPLLLRKVYRLAESLKQQIDDILNLAKMKREEFEPKALHIDLREILQKMELLVEGLCVSQPRTRFRTSLILDPPHETGLVQDIRIVETILKNLLGNAVKFSDPRRSNEIELRLQRMPGRLLIRVSDTGIGIPPEHQGRIFEEFYQVEGEARRRYEGTGLGLAMVRRFVELVQGTIHLSSTIDVGTTITIELPELKQESIVQDHSEQVLLLDPVPQSEETSKSTRQDLSGQRILVIDDHFENCDVLVTLLKMRGADASFALNGREGLEQMRARSPDILLLDMMMPDVSGEDVLQSMQADERLIHIPTIIVTARASDEDKLRSLALGADDYVAKPILEDELIFRIQNILKRSDLVSRIALLEAKQEHQDKLIQIGELFQELSHEVKNILFAASTVSALKPQDGLLSLAILPLADTLAQRVAEALVSPQLHPQQGERFRKLLADSSISQSFPQQLLMFLAELKLEMNHVLELLDALRSVDGDELDYTMGQLKLYSQYRALVEGLARIQVLTRSVLSFTRSSNQNSTCSLDTVWQSALVFIQLRLKATSVRLTTDLAPLELAIPSTDLMQVLLNLVFNALDALEHLMPEDQWITIESQVFDHDLILRVSNGGPPIPVAVQSRLFERGFTTKGDKGSGIGLHASQRMLQRASGDLRYDTTAAHPSFTIHIPRIAYRAAS